MLTAVAMAGAMTLIQIQADDTRLADDGTFVSETAQAVFAGETEGNVLCFDNPPATKSTSICLEVEEWRTAIDESKNYKPKRRGYVPGISSTQNTTASGSKYGLTSSPSTFRSHR